MSTDEKTCGSRAYRNDQLATCDRELNHDGVHLGRIPDDDGDGLELVQWTGVDAIGDDDGEDADAPIWYHALPIGKTVDVGSRGGGWANVTLTGAVLDDHEQVAALRVSWNVASDPRDVTHHVLVPWHAISSLSWAGES